MIGIQGGSALTTAIIVGVLIAGCSQAAKTKDDCSNMINAFEAANAEFISVPMDGDLTKMTDNGHKAAAVLRNAADKMSNPELKQLILSSADDYDHFGTSTGESLTFDRLEQAVATIEKKCSTAE